MEITKLYLQSIYTYVCEYSLLSFLKAMKFITESTLFVLLLCCCCCCVTVDAKCWVKCPKDREDLSEINCALKDDRTSYSCDLHPDELTLASNRFVNKSVFFLFEFSSIINQVIIYDNSYPNFGSRLSGIDVKIAAFRMHPRIKSLTIAGKQTNIYFHPGFFYMLRNLEGLALAFPTFRYFPYFSHSNPSLRILRMFSFSLLIPNNYNTVLRSGHLNDLSKLSYLQLESHHPVSTTDQTFSGLTALTHLNLTQFDFYNPVATFSPLVKLKSLDNVNSNLTDISFLKYSRSLFHLTQLSLSNNLFTSIPNNIFTNYTNLVSLDLRSNRIDNLKLSINSFKGLNSLKRIALGSSSTVISHLSSRIFENLNQLRKIDFNNLPLNCDCSLQWISKVRINFLNSRCSTPQHSGKRATDPSFYANCLQELSYQCFDRSNSCPTGSYCHDTLDSYTCVCERRNYYFVKHLNKCVSPNKIGCLKNRSRSNV